MSIKLYGIPNCDTVKQSRQWLDRHDLEYEFHDYKKSGIDRASLQKWCRAVGLEKILNRRGTTWRKLDDTDRADVDEAKAILLMQEHTSLIKRPVLESGKSILIGFKPEEWETLL